MKKYLLAILFLGIYLFSFELQASPLKLGVLAPDGTSWSTSLRQMAKEIEAKTAGRVQFKTYFGGSQGDEGDVLKKIRIGQLHGGFFTGKTVGELSSDVRVIELPFMFGADNKRAMNALDKVEKTLGKGFEKAQLKCLGLYGLGFVYFVSQKKFSDLESLKGMKIWTWDGDKISMTMIDSLNLASVSLALPDVLSALSTGMLSATYAPPMAIVALQWNSKIKYLLDYPLAYAMGAFLIDQKEWNKISLQDQKVFQEIATTTLRKITADNEKENVDALLSMKNMGVEFMRLPEKDLKQVDQIKNKVIGRLKGTFISPQAIQLVEGTK